MERDEPAIDPELAEFEAALLKDEEVTKRDVFDRATVFAEPQLNDDLPTGFPPSASDQPTSTTADPVPEETEEEVRKRKQEEEKELIMDR